MNLFNPRLFNPLHWHLRPLLRNPKIRYIYIEGGSSASKTAEICNTLMVDQLEHKYSTMVFRRFHVNILDSIYKSFQLANKRLGLDEAKLWQFQQDLIKAKRGKATIRFRGLDDEENIKGIEDYDIIYNNEWSQMTEVQWGQQRKRLRGRPNQKFICDWNPISSLLWIYKDWIDLDEWTDLPLGMPGAPTKYTNLNAEHSFKRINKRGDSIWIKITHRDNYWIVGHPSGKGGFRDEAVLNDYAWDKIHKPNLYRVYANGERGIMRTGGEFWKQFNELLHVRPVPLEKTTVHVSLDENVNPYITSTVWQVVGQEIRQVAEVICRTPHNNAPKAAAKLVSYLHSIKYEDVVFIYGDPSARKKSTTDENSASFYDKYIAVLQNAGFAVVNRVQKAAPEVALSAAFINDLYEHQLNGWSIVIGDTCSVSIEDYAVVKEDIDGSMKKSTVKDKETDVTYEPYGHCSDAKRYFITTILKAEFIAYKSRAKKLFGIG